MGLSEMTTRVSRSMRDGSISAESVIPLGFESRELRVSTRKQNRGLVTSAQVVKNTGDGCFSYVMFGDFNKTLATAQARATLKTIETQHRTALETIGATLAEAIAFYRAKVPA